jgi:hypothetical protein
VVIEIFGIKIQKSQSKQLLALTCRNRGSAIFNSIVVMFAGIFLLKGLGALDD